MSGGKPRIAYPRTLHTHTHTHRQGYPRWPAGSARPLRELMATEDKQEGGKEGETEGGRETQQHLLEKKRLNIQFTEAEDTYCLRKCNLKGSYGG